MLGYGIRENETDMILAVAIRSAIAIQAFHGEMRGAVMSILIQPSVGC